MDYGSGLVATSLTAEGAAGARRMRRHSWGTLATHFFVFAAVLRPWPAHWEVTLG